MEQLRWHKILAVKGKTYKIVEQFQNFLLKQFVHCFQQEICSLEFESDELFAINNSI